MKIDRLRTLSQFVEYLYSEHNFFNKADSPNTLNGQKACYFDWIVNYMQFLQQPLKKEMFVNEIEKPDCTNYGILPKRMLNEDYENDLRTFKEAEKKVIFDLGFNIHYPSIKEFRYADIICDTLEDLAIASEGQFNLQNVEI